MRPRWLAPLALALAAPALADPATETEHVVEAGETMNGIANRARVPVSVIAEANGLVQPYRLQAGQRLVIPRQRVHTVKSGETGLGIASRYGVPLAQIAVANGLEAPYAVRIGQRLIIPAVVSAPAARQPARTRPFFRPPHDGERLLGWAMRDGGKGHDGIDYAAAPLDMVRASAGGVVTQVREGHSRYGNVVVIDHGQGWQSVYAHLDSATVSVGEAVKGGERIGLAGSSGAATRTELHFELRHDGKRVDPAPILREDGAN